MAANLVIVESPAKANTIKGYLGSNYKVIASKGHIRDLPKSQLGIDFDNNYEPKYINIKASIINELTANSPPTNNLFNRYFDWYVSGVVPDSGNFPFRSNHSGCTDFRMLSLHWRGI